MRTAVILCLLAAVVRGEAEPKKESGPLAPHGGHPVAGYSKSTPVVIPSKKAVTVQKTYVQPTYEIGYHHQTGHITKPGYGHHIGHHGVGHGLVGAGLIGG